MSNPASAAPPTDAAAKTMLSNPLPCFCSPVRLNQGADAASSQSREP